MNWKFVEGKSPSANLLIKNVFQNENISTQNDNVMLMLIIMLLCDVENRKYHERQCIICIESKKEDLEKYLEWY